jgi:hypothetical protein
MKKIIIFVMLLFIYGCSNTPEEVIDEIEDNTCKNLSEHNEMACWHQRAIEIEDPTLCLKMDTISSQTGCFRELARTYKNNDYCDLAKKEDNCWEDMISTPKEDCEVNGGNWKTFSNTCVDSCELIRDEGIVCGEAMTDGCDCGPTMCWDDMRCVQNVKYKNM